MSKYKIIGIDMDGTLLDSNGKLPKVNCEAIVQAHKANVHIVPCTGRGWREAKEQLQNAPKLGYGVFNTGAVVADVPSGKSHDIVVIEPHVVMDLVEFLRNQPEAILVYKEHNLAGYEYLVTGDGEVTKNTRWWFDAVGAKVHHQRNITADDLHHSVRVGMVTTGARVKELTPKIEKQFADYVQLHSFTATNYDNERDDSQVFVMEIFASGVDKWRGLRWVAKQHNIDPKHIATIGDQINDIPMLKQAGCSIAMKNGIDEAKKHADYITDANDNGGVAKAIDKILSGKWGRF